MTVSELLKKHPLPWSFYKEGSDCEGFILDSNNSAVCWFGDSELWNQRSGWAPEDDVMNLLLSLINGLKP